MRNAIILLAAIGALAFGGAFALSWQNPILVEQAMREVLRIEVERQVGERIDTLSGSRIAGFAHEALQGTGLQIEDAEREIREQAPRRIANVVADMVRADCECRRRLVSASEGSARERLSRLASVQERLLALIESAYSSASRSLMREFRIFTASNAIAFALLGIVTVVRRRAGLQLLLPAVVLVGAVALTGAAYLFGQDWLHTIVFGEYVGFAYSLYLSAAALLLVDIAFNRARVSTQMVNLGLNAVGAAATAIPC